MATKATSNNKAAVESKEEKESSISNINWNEKGLDAFNNYLKNAFAQFKKDGNKYGLLQLCSLVELLEKCQEKGIIDSNVDLCDIQEDEDEFTKLLDNLTLKSYVDNMEYLVISENVGKAIQDVDIISCSISDGYENTHTGNLKADAFEKIVRKIQRLIKKQDYQMAFGYALGLTYNCIDDTNGNAYWLNDNEIPDEIDSNILKPMAKIWSQLLIKNVSMSTFGCFNLFKYEQDDEYRIRKDFICYLKRVKSFVNSSFDFYEDWNVKFPVLKKVKKKIKSAANSSGQSKESNDDQTAEPPKKRRKKSKDQKND